jgi:CRP-like cAMP-binding protein
VSTKEVVTRLSQVPLFSGCTQRDLQTIARVVKDIDHGSGTVIAREGEPGIGLFVIADGTAEVTIGGSKKATLGPGDFFGLTEWVFRGLMQEHPSIAVRVLQAMAGRLRNATKSATS